MYVVKGSFNKQFPLIQLFKLQAFFSLIYEEIKQPQTHFV